MQGKGKPGASLILMARFGFFLMEIGLAKSFGVLVPALEEQLQTSNAVIGLVTSLSLSAMYIGSPLSKFALHHCPKSRRRFLTSISGLVAGVALVGTAFTNNVVGLSVLFLTMGLCCSVINLQAIVLLFDYYQEDYSFASCVSVLGIPVGAAILPPITKTLLDEYGVSGSLLLIGALTLNMFPIGLALKERAPAKQRNVPKCAGTSHDVCPNGGAGEKQSRENSAEKVDRDHADQSPAEKASVDDNVVIGLGKEPGLSKRSSVMQLILSQEESPLATPDSVPAPLEEGRRLEITLKGPVSSTSLSNGDRVASNKHVKDFSCQMSSEDDIVVIGVDTEHGHTRSSVVQLIGSDGGEKDNESHAIPLEHQYSSVDDLEPPVSFSPEEAMFQHVKGTTFEGDATSDNRGVTSNGFEDNESPPIDSTSITTPSCQGNLLKGCLSRCHLWVLVDEPLFTTVYLPTVVLLFTVTGGWALFTVLYAVEHDIDLSLAAYLPTCGAIGGIVASLVMSAAMWHRPRWSPKLYLISLIISASCFFLQTLNSSFVYLVAMSFLIGFGLFAANVIVEAVMTMIVLPKNFSDAGSVFLFAVGFGYLLSGYLAGLVRDTTNDIKLTFVFLGALTVLAILLLVALLFFLLRREHSHSDPRTQPAKEMEVAERENNNPGNQQDNQGFEPV